MSERPCVVCGKRLANATMHERTKHGIYRRGPRAEESKAVLRAAHMRKVKAEKKRAAAAVPTTEVVTLPVPVNGFGSQTPRFEVMPFVVLGTDDGGIWLAERIR
jgi:hypothetical protein